MRTRAIAITASWVSVRTQPAVGPEGRLSIIEIEGGSREGAARIELADLKERIRKLEAIASGVDL